MPKRGGCRCALRACAGVAGFAPLWPMNAEEQFHDEHVRIAHEKQVAIYRNMTPGQRLEQAMRMNEEMRELMAAGFRARHPEWSDSQVKKAVAERILYARTG